MYALKHPPIIITFTLLFFDDIHTMWHVFRLNRNYRLNEYAHIWGSKLCCRNEIESLDILWEKLLNFLSACLPFNTACVSHFSGGKKVEIPIKECRWNSNAESYYIWIRRDLQLLLRTQNCHTYFFLNEAHWPTLLARFFAYFCLCMTKKLAMNSEIEYMVWCRVSFIWPGPIAHRTVWAHIPKSFHWQHKKLIENKFVYSTEKITWKLL